MVPHAGNPSTREVKVRGSEAQCQHWLHSEFKGRFFLAEDVYEVKMYMLSRSTSNLANEDSQRGLAWTVMDLRTLRGV